MGSTATGHRPPVPVMVLSAVALLMVCLLLAQSAVGLLFGILRLMLILIAFLVFGTLGLYLWRRGELRRVRSGRGGGR